MERCSPYLDQVYKLRHWPPGTIQITDRAAFFCSHHDFILSGVEFSPTLASIGSRLNIDFLQELL
jgi:hypothetical protein